MVGTMIELPRAALTADQIAEEAEFFSFGTNDLTQTTYGISRDDINHFLPAYLKAGIFKQDPFATLDQAGVGSLVKTASRQGTRDPAESQGRHLRRTRRRSRVRQVLPQDRAQLRVLLAVPSADGAAGSGAGCSRRDGRRRAQHEVTSPVRAINHKGAASAAPLLCQLLIQPPHFAGTGFLLRRFCA